MAVGTGLRGLRTSLSTELEDGLPCTFAIPLDARLRTRLLDYQAHARAIEGHLPQSLLARPATRTCLLHLRALQALDATQAGAAQRDIAETLFGAEAVRRHWHADSEVRAQVRYLISRAEGLMRGGYLALAGVRRKCPGAQGDEPVH
ncbi:DUF2285 domain-containing protein [Variovorax sp. SRS16]|uniref:DUF2285 domain-containing protein n=1 Tax=Variovorax sp. SRS16 TaxID=282217 RepID=UPI001E3FC66B|nr:DUF2285 domain-containing protein [Variovorax sp. SRS16]